MSALNGLHSLLETESAQRKFLDFQLEQMVNDDIRDLRLAMEGEDADLPDIDDKDLDDEEECGTKECGDGACGFGSAYCDDDDCDDDSDWGDDDDYDDDDDDNDFVNHSNYDSGNSDLTGDYAPSGDEDLAQDDLEESLGLDMDMDIESFGPEPSNESADISRLLNAIPESSPREVANFQSALESGGLEATTAILEEETALNCLLA